MLKYGINEKMTFYVLIGHERQKLFWGIIICIRRVPPSNVVVVTFLLLTSLWKGYFLRRRLKRYRHLMVEIAVLMFFFIFSCKLLAKCQCGIDLCMMDGHNFSSIMLTFFTETSPLRTSAPFRKHMWVTMDERYVPLSFQFQFALKLFNISWICQRNTGLYPKHFCVDVHDVWKRLWAEIIALQITYR